MKDETNIKETNDQDVQSVPKKRGRKPNPNKKMYFSEKEENAFREYCLSKDESFRNRVFKETLYPAFSKMVESIIRRYTLFTPGEEFDYTFNDTMSHLVSKVYNFDFEKNTKAYSYCGTICKNYLLGKRKDTQKEMSRTVSYDNVYNDSNPDPRESDELPYKDKGLNATMMCETANEIGKMLQEPEKYNLNDSDIKVGYALIELLVHWEDIFKRYDETYWGIVDGVEVQLIPSDEGVFTYRDEFGNMQIFDNNTNTVIVKDGSTYDINSKKYNKSNVDSFIREATLLKTKQIRDAKKKYANVYQKLKEKVLKMD